MICLSAARGARLTNRDMDSDSFMIQGMMVASFPMVIGCDASGVVVEVGQDAKSAFKVGDRVCGCTRLGDTGHGTFQEYVC